MSQIYGAQQHGEGTQARGDFNPENVVDMDEGTVSPEVVVVGPDGVPWRKKRSQQQRRASAFRSNRISCCGRARAGGRVS